MNDWAEIRRLHVAEGLSQRAISKRLGVSRTTVSRAVASPVPKTYSRPPRSSKFDGVEYWVIDLLREFPDMPATVLAERVGWEGSNSWFRKQVADLRPAVRPVDPADRLTYQPGDQMQCDVWFPLAKIPLGFGQWGSPPVLVMVASFPHDLGLRVLCQPVLLSSAKSLTECFNPCQFFGKPARTNAVLALIFTLTSGSKNALSGLPAANFLFRVRLYLLSWTLVAGCRDYQFLARLYLFYGWIKCLFSQGNGKADFCIQKIGFPSLGLV